MYNIFTAVFFVVTSSVSFCVKSDTRQNNTATKSILLLIIVIGPSQGLIIIVILINEKYFI